MSSPVPSFNVSALAGEFQTMTGGGDATKGLTFDFCASVVEGVVADPHFTGVNDDDVRRVLGLDNAVVNDRVTALEQRDALITQALHRILTGDYTGASGAAADVVALQGGTDDITGKVKTPVFEE